MPVTDTTETDAPYRPPPETTAQCVPLTLDRGHLFIRLPEGRFLVDTGNPGSFGRVPSLTIQGRSFRISGRGPLEVESFVGAAMDGLIGTDILNQFDVLFDLSQGLAWFSTGELTCGGERLPIDFVMTIPRLGAAIRDTRIRVFFDTGAPLNYYQGDWADFPREEPAEDFFPGYGTFQTDTARVPMLLGRRLYQLKAGRLPGILGMALATAGTTGIVGVELFQGRRVGYFPRRSSLVLSQQR